jgi:hypothetical protein
MIFIFVKNKLGVSFKKIFYESAAEAITKLWMIRELKWISKTATRIRIPCKLINYVRLSHHFKLFVIGEREKIKRKISRSPSIDK